MVTVFDCIDQGHENSLLYASQGAHAFISLTVIPLVLSCWKKGGTELVFLNVLSFTVANEANGR